MNSLRRILNSIADSKMKMTMIPCSCPLQGYLHPSWCPNQQAKFFPPQLKKAVNGNSFHLKISNTITNSHRWSMKGLASIHSTEMMLIGMNKLLILYFHSIRHRLRMLYLMMRWYLRQDHSLELPCIGVLILILGLMKSILVVQSNNRGMTIIRLFNKLESWLIEYST